ncbi:WhiB family transcriptional regulator [Phytoactinopolyspora limicola]|uniref:WhiB family transcriptional regulator n=1 Tax=Phytoactinopolyspora limicola TaxID=2715536 RepID=UPI002483ACDC|nr:WhiB family transcriptional regulator [Phytoactinopolyspora limicola]
MIQIEQAVTAETPLSGVSRPEWMSWASCRKADPEIFFPIGTVGPAVEQIEAAKEICASCRVTAECLAYAFDTGQGYGVWGGTTAEERRSVRGLSRRGVQLGGL